MLDKQTSYNYIKDWLNGEKGENAKALILRGTKQKHKTYHRKHQKRPPSDHQPLRFLSQRNPPLKIFCP